MGAFVGYSLDLTAVGLFLFKVPSQQELIVDQCAWNSNTK